MLDTAAKRDQFMSELEGGSVLERLDRVEAALLGAGLLPKPEAPAQPVEGK